jgi:hypothetical protein
MGFRLRACSVMSRSSSGFMSVSGRPGGAVVGQAPHDRRTDAAYAAGYQRAPPGPRNSVGGVGAL